MTLLKVTVAITAVIVCCLGAYPGQNTQQPTQNITR